MSSVGLYPTVRSWGSLFQPILCGGRGAGSSFRYLALLFCCGEGAGA